MKVRKTLFLLLLAGLLSAPMVLSGCETQTGTVQTGSQTVPASGDLMQGVTARALSDASLPQEVQDAFQTASADFALDLFRHAQEKNKNSLLSPMSAACALAMTSNGAAGDTQSEFLSLLGDSQISQQQLNQAYRTWIGQVREQQNGIVSLANSIWVRQNDGLAVKQDFLQANADSFGAGVYQKDFSAPATRDQINAWVSEHTNGKITEIIEEIDPDTVMYLINTLYFEMDWKVPFEASGTQKQDFSTADHQKVSADFMTGPGNDAFYLSGKQVRGIKKAYADDRYSFIALLPDEGISLEDYLSTLTGEDFLFLSRQKMTDPLVEDASQSQMQVTPPKEWEGKDWEGMEPEEINRARRTVSYSLPKFKYSYGKQLKDALISMGLQRAFGSTADFSNLAQDALERGVYIGQVLQKTFIEVDELGTKAGAATLVDIKEESAPMYSSSVHFNRPFLYAIVENDSGLPLFLGTVTNPLEA